MTDDDSEFQRNGDLHHLKIKERRGQRLGVRGGPLLLGTGVRKVKFQCAWGAGEV